jgi:putative SOS response-associated peptidase YedK
MCGRYTLTTDLFNLKLHFSFDDSDEAPGFEDWKPRFNIAPSQLAPVVVSDGGRPRLKLMKWGLVPSWSKDEKIGYKMINARSETAPEKPSFRKPFAERRCLVPADGFYEWRKDGELKVPTWIHRPDRGIFCFAGLWESWRSAEAAPVVQTFTILTTSANSVMAPIHDRMPVILSPEDERRWISSATPREELVALMKPYREDGLSPEAVSTLVNSPRNDVADCIRPV